MILVFGNTGQVATELALLDNAQCIGRDDADLSNPQECYAAIRAARPKAVINAAAYTDVDKAEGEETLATIINADAPTAMANACQSLGIPFVHISTDYVFNGLGTDPWEPADTPDPHSAYGRSKLKGERGVLDSGANSVILRTSWVFSAHGKNFVKTMLSLSKTKNSLSIVSDQIGGPTSARAIAKACREIANQMLSGNPNTGIYHFAGAPNVSWQQFAIEIFKAAQKDISISAISSEDYPTRAKRPNNSRLNCDRLEKDYGIYCADWRADMQEVLVELGVIKA